MGTRRSFCEGPGQAKINAPLKAADKEDKGPSYSKKKAPISRKGAAHGKNAHHKETTGLPCVRP